MVIVFLIFIHYSCIEQEKSEFEDVIKAVDIIDSSNLLDEEDIYLKLNEPSLKYLQGKYCISKDGYSLSLHFKQKNDIIYLFFVNVINNGNLIIENFSDENNYSYFNIKDIKNTHNVKIDIKNPIYNIHSYDNCEYYMLNISFNTKDEILFWKISFPNKISNLPSTAILTKCQ